MTYRNKVRKVIERLDIKRINNAFVYEVETSCSEVLAVNNINSRTDNEFENTRNSKGN